MGLRIFLVFFFADSSTIFVRISSVDKMRQKYDFAMTAFNNLFYASISFAHKKSRHFDTGLRNEQPALDYIPSINKSVVGLLNK